MAGAGVGDALPALRGLAGLRRGSWQQEVAGNEAI